MALIGPMKYLTIGGSTYEIQGQEITSSAITSALGYTPYNGSTNPNGYTTNTGTVTEVTVGNDLKVGTTVGGNFTTSGTISHANSVTAKTTQAIYPIKFDANGHITGAGDAVTIPTVPSITLNGSSTTSPNFYAPTSAGTSGYYLKSNGSGAPSWTVFPTIPTVPSSGSSATAVGTSSSGGGASTWSRSDHQHNITSATIISALGFTPVSSSNVPNAGTTATAVGTSASGGSATTWSKSDHVHNITSSTITTALGYTPSVVQIVRW